MNAEDAPLQGSDEVRKEPGAENASQQDGAEARKELTKETEDIEEFKEEAKQMEKQLPSKANPLSSAQKFPPPRVSAWIPFHKSMTWLLVEGGLLIAPRLMQLLTSENESDRKRYKVIIATLNDNANYKSISANIMGTIRRMFPKETSEFESESMMQHNDVGVQTPMDFIEYLFVNHDEAVGRSGRIATAMEQLQRLLDNPTENVLEWVNDLYTAANNVANCHGAKDQYRDFYIERMLEQLTIKLVEMHGERGDRFATTLSRREKSSPPTRKETLRELEHLFKSHRLGMTTKQPKTVMFAGRNKPKKKDGRDDFEGNCFECGRKGHKKADCPRRKKKRNRKPQTNTGPHSEQLVKEVAKAVIAQLTGKTSTPDRERGAGGVSDFRSYYAASVTNAVHGGVTNASRTSTILLDSGASVSIFCDKAYFPYGTKPYEGELQIANGETVNCNLRTGQAVFEVTNINDETETITLLSAVLWTDVGKQLLSKNDVCGCPGQRIPGTYFGNKDGHVKWHNTHPIATFAEDNMEYLRVRPISAKQIRCNSGVETYANVANSLISFDPEAFEHEARIDDSIVQKTFRRGVGFKTKQPIWLWHVRLGHASIATVKATLKHCGHAHASKSKYSCEVCAFFRTSRRSYLDSHPENPHAYAPPPRTSDPGLWHVDMKGPIAKIRDKPVDASGIRLFVLIAVNDHTRFTFSRVLTQKSAIAVADALEQLITEMAPRRPVTTIRCDRGREFDAVTTKSRLAYRGVDVLFSTPGRPNSNHRAERGVRDLMRVVNKLCMHVAPTRIFPYVVMAATRLKNAWYNPEIDTTPERAQLGRSIEYKLCRAFMSTVYAKPAGSDEVQKGWYIAPNNDSRTATLLFVGKSGRLNDVVSDSFTSDEEMVLRCVKGKIAGDTLVIMPWDHMTTSQGHTTPSATIGAEEDNPPNEDMLEGIHDTEYLSEDAEGVEEPESEPQGDAPGQDSTPSGSATPHSGGATVAPSQESLDSIPGQEGVTALDPGEADATRASQPGEDSEQREGGTASRERSRLKADFGPRWAEPLQPRRAGSKARSSERLPRDATMLALSVNSFTRSHTAISHLEQVLLSHRPTTDRRTWAEHCEFFGECPNLVMALSEVGASKRTLTYSEVLRHEHCQLFLDALLQEQMKFEIGANVKEVPFATARQEGGIIFRSMAIFTEKRTGNKIKAKARIVIDGSPGLVDQGCVAAPVVAYPELKLLEAIGFGSHGWGFCTDISAAYLNASLSLPGEDKRVFFHPPKGWKRRNKTKGAYLLTSTNAIYGLKESAAAWHRDLRKTLLRLQFTTVPEAPCIFVRGAGTDNWCMIGVFVDDIRGWSGTKSERARVLQQLQETYTLSSTVYDEETASHSVLGLTYTTAKNTLHISNEQYISKDLSDKFPDIAKRPPVHTPVRECEIKLLAPHAGDVDHNRKKRYQELLGCVMFCANTTRMDVTTITNRLGRFAHNPSDGHLQVLERTARYMMSTPAFGLRMRRFAEESVTLEMYSDADLGSAETNTPTVGVIVLLNGQLIDWRSKTRKLAALSSTEAELQGITMAIKTGLVMRKILTHLGHEQRDLTTLWVDSRPARMALMRKFGTDRSKYYQRVIKWVQTFVETPHSDEKHIPKEFRVKWVKTDANLADCLTKILGRVKFQGFRDRMMHDTRKKG